MNLSKEGDKIGEQPVQITRLERGLSMLGVAFHEGTSGKDYGVGEEVYDWQQRFAAGVTRVDTSNNVVARPYTNPGGFPEIVNEDGNKMVVMHSYHAHDKTSLRADGVPVKTKALLNDEEWSDFEDHLMGLP